MPFEAAPRVTASSGTPPRPGAAPAEAIRSNTVTPMAGTDIEPKGADEPALPPSALVSEIERTRADLARTIDEIADRVSPGNVARRTADRARERLSQVDPLIGGAVVLAAASVTCYLIWRKIRR